MDKFILIYMTFIYEEKKIIFFFKNDERKYNNIIKNENDI